MIFSYGITIQGAYHKKNGSVCQDSHRIAKCNDSLVVAAVADGLGSEKYSDIASKTAVDYSIDYCATHLTDDCDDERILEIIQQSFELSQNKIEEEAKKNNHEIDQYDTTLCLAILKQDELFWGQSGDSGIIALCTDGFYEQVTKQQRDEYGCVYPLVFSDKWSFGKYAKRVSSVLLATDGMLETFFPYLLRNEVIQIYVALADYFMNYEKLDVINMGEEMIQSKMYDYISSIPEDTVTDDKTLVVIGNTDVIAQKQPASYYEVPNWEELKRKRDEEWRRQAYPSLFMNDNSDQQEKE